MKTIKTRYIIFTIFLPLILVGCARVEPKVINAGQSSYFQPERVSTIAIMPLRNEGGDPDIAERIIRELTLQILQLDRFEVIDHYKVSTLVAEKDLEAVDLTDTIVKNIGRRLRADAILLGDVTNYKAGGRKFWPLKSAPVIGLSARMVFVKDPIPTTIWTINDIFDGGDPAMQQLVDNPDQDKIQTDVHFLIKVMCQEIAKTLNF